MLSTPLWSDFARKLSRLWRGLVSVTPFRHKSRTDGLTQLWNPGIVQYAKSLWTTFETEFGDIERELKRRNENVTEETRLASEQAASQARHLQAIDQQAASEYRKDGRLFRKRVDQSRNETRAWRKQVDQRESSERYSRRASQNAAEYEVTGARKQRLLDQLSTYDHLAALKENHRKRHGTTSTWLSKRAEYLKWLESILSSVFWLSGIRR